MSSSAYFGFFDRFAQIFLEQKKMLKTGLNIAHFKQHVQIIEDETKEYFEKWGDSGEESKLKRKHINNVSNVFLSKTSI